MTLGQIFNSISKKEWRFVIFMALAMIIITGLPYLYAYLTAPEGLVYNGLNSLTPGDSPVYYSYINQVKTGQIFLKDLFTGEAQNFGMFNIIWFLVGIFARVFQLSPAIAFHLSRLILIPIFLAAAYFFISLFFSEKIKRKICLLFLLFSGGLGGYIIFPLSLFDFSTKASYWMPIDVWVPEAITFLTIYKTPHFIASITLMVLIFLLMILAFEKKRWGYSFWAGVLALVYFNFHPFYIPTIFGTLGLYLLILIFKERKIIWAAVGQYLLFIIVTLPSIFYHFWLLAESPVIKQRALQNITPAPPFFFILAGYGFLSLGAIFGIAWLIKQKKFNNYFIFLFSWLTFSILLVELPIQFQSRYLHGLHFPLVIFTIVGLFAIKDLTFIKKFLLKYNFLSSNKLPLVIILFFSFGFSVFFNLVRDFHYFTFRPGEIINYFYLSEDKVAAMKWLAGLAPAQAILATPRNSLFIPSLSNQPVFIAHGIETIDYQSKWLYLQWFLSSDKNPEKKYQFLKNYNIDYLFITSQEKKPGYFNPETKDYLTLVYQNPEVEIYQVLTQ